MTYNKKMTIQERVQKLISQSENENHALNKLRLFKDKEYYDDYGKMLEYLEKNNEEMISDMIVYIENQVKEKEKEKIIEDAGELPDYLSVFRKEFSLIKNKEIQGLTKKAFDKVDPKFFKVAASSTGKYHPQISLNNPDCTCQFCIEEKHNDNLIKRTNSDCTRYGGLVRHTKAVCYFAIQLSNIANISDENMDLILSACMLHDTCKSGLKMESKGTVHEHPILVKQLLHPDELTENEKQLWGKINHLIASHMGQWNTSKYSNIELPIPSDPLQKFVHTCDYLASRRELDFDKSLFEIIE